jgi:hypothetical protein
VDVVGADKRHALGIGEVEQRSLDASLGVLAMPLQLDVEAVAEQLLQPLELVRRRR